MGGEVVVWQGARACLVVCVCVCVCLRVCACECMGLYA